MVTYDRERYADEAGCSASDTISHSLDVHGKWEAWESLVVTTILADPAGWVVDIGCQIGWYTLLAAEAGHPVVAIDANPESLDILAQNCDLNGYTDVTRVLAWLGVDTPTVPAGGHVRFLKADIEGLEAEAVRAFGPSFAAGEVDYALLELTPDFNDTWRTAHDAMLSHGMVAFQVPDKGDDTETFAADPLGVTLTRPFDPDQKFGQLNVFFVRKDLL
jgi:SAM-dependent methyltransferase